MCMYFNSHAHVERDIKVKTYDIDEYDFNSHAHVERDHSDDIFTTYAVISTHTLTWSVTSKMADIFRA